ncbi:hypothetical protein B0H13DRAFT_1864171 [Mycena leptocephala]|nr:hypothetical protein B0H13DRAFT_1864171 [Mycena leptocephala]
MWCRNGLWLQLVHCALHYARSPISEWRSEESLFIVIYKTKGDIMLPETDVSQQAYGKAVKDTMLPLTPILDSLHLLLDYHDERFVIGTCFHQLASIWISEVDSGQLPGRGLHGHRAVRPQPTTSMEHWYYWTGVVCV